MPGLVASAGGDVEGCMPRLDVRRVENGAASNQCHGGGGYFHCIHSPMIWRSDFITGAFLRCSRPQWYFGHTLAQIF
jgi:hypothetical protein